MLSIGIVGLSTTPTSAAAGTREDVDGNDRWCNASEADDDGEFRVL